MGRGRDAEAVAVIHAVAEYNGVRSSLTLDHLTRIGTSKNLDSYNSETAIETGVRPNHSAFSRVSAAKRVLTKYDTQHIKSLFRTRKLAYSTTLVITVWGERYSFR